MSQFSEDSKARTTNGKESSGTGKFILIVKQSESTAGSMDAYFKDRGYTVKLATKTSDAIGLTNGHSFDAIIVDLNMPLHGDRPLVEFLRRYNRHSTIIVITDEADIQARVAALHSVADDFLVRPYELDRLHARLVTRIQLRSLQGLDEIHIGNLLVKPKEGVAKRCGQLLDLTGREYQLLAYLASRHGHVVARKEINEHVFEIDSDSSTNLVDVYVGYLRAKIEFKNEPKILHTYRGRGYMLGVLQGSESATSIND